MLATDLHHRGVPWMWLLLKEGPSAGSRSLNLRTKEKWCTALVGGALLGLAAALVFWSAWPLLASALALLTVLVWNRRFYAYLYRHRNTGFAVQSSALHLLCYVVNGFSVFSGSLMHALFGEPVPPVDVTAQAEVGIKTWPPGPVRPPRSMWDHGPAGAPGNEGESNSATAPESTARGSTFGVRA
jgi:hypothetical protein